MCFEEAKSCRREDYKFCDDMPPADRVYRYHGGVEGLLALTRLARVRAVSAIVSTGQEDCDAAMQMLAVGWRFRDVCISLLE